MLGDDRAAAAILEQQAGFVPRFPLELLLVERERVFECPGDIRCQVGLDRIEIDQPQVVGLEC